MHGIDLDQLFQFRIVLRPVSGLVRVRNNEHILGIVGLVQAGVEQGEPIGILGRDCFPAIRSSEQNVVVTAALDANRPFVSKIRDELSRLMILDDQVIEGLPTQSHPARCHARTR